MSWRPLKVYAAGWQLLLFLGLVCFVPLFFALAASHTFFDKSLGWALAIAIPFVPIFLGAGLKDIEGFCGRRSREIGSDS